jgi:hypothetical protein
MRIPLTFVSMSYHCRAFQSLDSVSTGSAARRSIVAIRLDSIHRDALRCVVVKTFPDENVFELLMTDLLRQQTTFLIEKGLSILRFNDQI